MISLEGRVPVSLNKLQLLNYLQAEVRLHHVSPYTSRLLTIESELQHFQMLDFNISSPANQLIVDIEMLIPVNVRLPLCKFRVNTKPKIKISILGTGFSGTSKIESLSLSLRTLQLNGALSVFEGMIRKNIIAQVEKLLPDILKLVNSKISELLSQKTQIDFNISGIDYNNLLYVKGVKLRECSSSNNSLLIDVFSSAYIENQNQGFEAEYYEIERKEHPGQFNVAIHQDFLKSILTKLITEVEIPVLNKKIPLVLTDFRVVCNVLYVGLELSEFYKGAWRLKLDTSVTSDTLRFSLLEMQSTGSNSLFDKGITKLLELGIEKLIQKYAEIPFSTINAHIAGGIKDAYHFDFQSSAIKLSVPKFSVKHITFDDKIVLVNCEWQDRFYLEL